MARRKLKKDDRRFLKKAGFGREHGALAGLACALHEAEQAPRCDGYVLQADSCWGERTRRRVRRERRQRFWRGLFSCCAGGPSSQKGRTPFCYAVAQALRSYAPAVAVVAGLVCVLCWCLLE